MGRRSRPRWSLPGLSPFAFSATGATVPSRPVGRDLTVSTADGVELQAELAVPDAPAGAAVLCHPHPTYGGEMRAGVIDTLFRELPGRGLAAMRFNFRGVGRSTGAHDHGIGEQEDVRAAAAALASAVPEFPLVLAGWSFGIDVALAVDVPEAAGWFGVAPVLGVVDPEAMVAAHDPRPKLLLVPEHDQYRSPAEAEDITAGWPAVELRTLPATDHFLAGAHATVLDALTGFLRDLA
jgi:uncharacterized protein